MKMSESAVDTHGCLGTGSAAGQAALGWLKELLDSAGQEQLEHMTR